ncbi:CD1247 N-terminal domain-containing protein [Clostridium sp.]|uniref:CD1247 N-terminal domain-containing protein n=1 Tax=Clostridium sp. TaxID=1506 RepID=UPI003F2B18AD
MKEINNDIEALKDVISKIDDKNNREIYTKITNILEKISGKVEDTILRQEYLEENVQYMDEDLTDLQEELFEEVSFDELSDFEDEYIEINCKNCNKPLFVEKESLNSKKEIPCPFCSTTAN